jgi:hypothetical protein
MSATQLQHLSHAVTRTEDITRALSGVYHGVQYCLSSTSTVLEYCTLDTVILLELLLPLTLYSTCTPALHVL